MNLIVGYQRLADYETQTLHYSCAQPSPTDIPMCIEFWHFTTLMTSELSCRKVVRYTQNKHHAISSFCNCN